MATRFVLPALGLLSAFTSSVNAALPTISTKGTKFFDSNNNQFFFKGVAYQLVPEDPLIDTAQCQRDATLMQQLGANSIRVSTRSRREYLASIPADTVFSTRYTTSTHGRTTMDVWLLSTLLVSTHSSTLTLSTPPSRRPTLCGHKHNFKSMLTSWILSPSTTTLQVSTLETRSSTALARLHWLLHISRCAKRGSRDDIE